MPTRKKPAKANAKKPPKKAAGFEKPETITCPHCRYERPAKDAHCHICGYPFDWMTEE